MARIISEKDPTTGRRQQVGAVEGQTFDERNTKVGEAFGVKPAKAARISNDKIAGSLGQLNSSNLTPVSDIKLAPTPAPVAAAGLQGQLESQTQQTDKFLTDLSAQRQKREEATTSARGDLMSYLQTEFQGKEGRTAAAYSQGGGVDEAEKLLTASKTEARNEQERLRKQVEAIQTAPGTATAAERDREVREVTRVSLRQQADIALKQLAAQGDYDGAKAVADRAVAVELEEQTQELEMRKFFYEENKDLFEKSEQREFEANLGERTRTLQNEEYRLRAEFDQKIKQNDPLYQLELRLKRASAAKTEYELNALQNPDPSEVDPKTLERINKLTDKGKETITNTGDTITQLTRIKDLVANNSVADLNNPLTEAGRLYQRLATDVADKMARERTGAVVTKEENGNFKRILGLGFLNQITASPEEINSEVDYFINKHNTAAQLYDPTGDIRKHLSDTVSTEGAYLDAVDESLGGNDPVSNYLSSMGISYGN